MKRDSELGTEVCAVASMSTPIVADHWPMGALVGFGAGPMAVARASSAARGWLAR